MNSDTPTSPRPTASPLRVAGAIAQLAALGVIGPAIFAMLFTLLGVGVGLVPVFGIGLLFLVGFVYAIYALGWFETARVDGLYDLGLPASGGCAPADAPGSAGSSAWCGSRHRPVDVAGGGRARDLDDPRAGSWSSWLGISASGIVLAFAPLFARSGAVTLAGTDIDVPSLGRAGGSALRAARRSPRSSGSASCTVCSRG